MYQKLMNCFGIVLAMMIFTGSALAQTKLDGIVAIINDEVLTQSDLKQSMNRATLQVSELNSSPLSISEIKSIALKQAVTEKVLAQYAFKTGFSISDEELDRAINSIASDQSMSVMEFRSVLSKNGIEWDGYRDSLKSQIMINQLRQREVVPNVKVTDEEINYFLRQINQDIKVSVRYLSAELVNQASDYQERLLKTMIRARESVINSSQPIQQMGKWSADPGLRGGDLGFISLDALPTLYFKAVQTMGPGEVSPLFKNEVGLHFLYLEKTNLAELVGQSQQKTHVQHILVKTDAVVTDKLAKEKIRNIRARYQEGESFEVLAKHFSTDYSASDGGDIGWVSSQDVLPPFAMAMNQLSIGEVSTPVQTVYGWHLIKVLGRKKSLSLQEELRSLAQQSIFNQKAQREFDEWVAQRVNEAYIKYVNQ